MFSENEFNLIRKTCTVEMNYILYCNVQPKYLQHIILHFKLKAKIILRSLFTINCSDFFPYNRVFRKTKSFSNLLQLHQIKIKLGLIIIVYRIQSE